MVSFCGWPTTIRVWIFHGPYRSIIWSVSSTGCAKNACKLAEVLEVLEVLEALEALGDQAAGQEDQADGAGVPAEVFKAVAGRRAVVRRAATTRDVIVGEGAGTIDRMSIGLPNPAK